MLLPPIALALAARGNVADRVKRFWFCYFQFYYFWFYPVFPRVPCV